MNTERKVIVGLVITIALGGVLYQANSLMNSDAPAAPAGNSARVPTSSSSGSASPLSGVPTSSGSATPGSDADTSDADAAAAKVL